MNKIIAHLSGSSISSNSSKAHTLYNRNSFGEKNGDKIEYSSVEALFLVERKNMEVLKRNEKIDLDDLMKIFMKNDKKIYIKYLVFKDLRKKGYIVKSALKFGAEFRIYEKGSKIGKSHAKWLVFTDKDSGKISWHEFSAKNRVSHSTRKNLLLAIVDDESGITYYEVKWLKP